MIFFYFLLTISDFGIRHVSVMVSDIRGVSGSVDGPFIINAKEKGAPKPLAKALTLFSQLLGFFSSSITLKSYAEHSAIRAFNSILYDFSFITLQRYTFLLKVRSLFTVLRVI